MVTPLVLPITNAGAVPVGRDGGAEKASDGGFVKTA